MRDISLFSYLTQTFVLTITTHYHYWFREAVKRLLNNTSMVIYNMSVLYWGQYWVYELPFAVGEGSRNFSCIGVWHNVVWVGWVSIFLFLLYYTYVNLMTARVQSNLSYNFSDWYYHYILYEFK